MKRTSYLRLILIVVVSSLIQNLYSQMPPRGGNQIRITGWADDSHYIIRTLNAEKQPVLQKVDIKSGIGIPVEAEKTDREIFSNSLPKGINLGLTDILSPDGKSAIFIKANDLYYLSVGDKELRRLTNDSMPEINTRFSPDGRKIAYTKNKDLYIYDLSKNKEIRLTSDASERIYNGYSSWVYMEEILGRGSRYAAFWWAPDGSKIAYLRTDETDVPLFTLNRLDEADGIHGKLEQVPYPKAGDPNPKVKMGIADATTGETTWVRTDYNADQYLAWPFWTPDSKKLAIQVVNRDQNDIKFILADPASGEYSVIYDESRKTWVDFFEDVYVMNDGTGFIIKSYKTDWDNLYYYAWSGKLIAQLTDFSWRVNGISRVDETARVVYFTGTGPESTDNHLFRVGLNGMNLLQISSGPGYHDVSISPKGSYFIDSWNNITTPGSMIAYDKKGKKIREVYKFDQPQFDSSENSRSELFRIKTSDGLFDMPAMITYPVNFDPARKYPVVFTIYGGPDSKNISANRWQGVNTSWYAKNGIITFTIDHRGSGHFGKKGLDYLYRSLGKWEILDYEDGVKWLRSKPFADSTKIGITGSSYGGYMTCLALTKGADYWTHGFAGSSVTDFRLYDDIYTERFMDTPQDNPEGYREGAATTYVKNYKGHLYLNHGDMDDNVHMQNSIWLISKLEDEGKEFEFMLYPDGRHGWGGNKAMHSRNESNRFWLRYFFDKD